MVEKPENAANIIHEFETTITSNKKNIIWLGKHQGIIFRKFKKSEKFKNIIGKFGVSRLTTSFTISTARLTKEFRKIKTTLFFLNFSKKHMKTIAEMYKGNLNEH